MTNANYGKHLKNIGKLCYLYDQAAASTTAMNTLRATALDQAATGLSADLISRYQPHWESAISAGPKERLMPL